MLSLPAICVTAQKHIQKGNPSHFKNGRGVNRKKKGPFKSSPYQHTGSLSVLIVDLGKRQLCHLDGVRGWVQEVDYNEELERHHCEENNHGEFEGALSLRHLCFLL